MVRQRGQGKSTSTKKNKNNAGPPALFKKPPEVLQPFLETLDEKCVYITHVDSHPRDFKQKIFLVPTLMNIALTAALLYRIWYIGPYYLRIFVSVLGYPNETTMVVDEMEWDEIIPEVAIRAFNFLLDFLLFVFVWSWPFDFVIGGEHGSPIMWRWNVGFRDREVVVRRSRKWVESAGDFVHDEGAKSLFMSRIGVATAPLLINEKTGYLLMNADWDLDWAAMVDANDMVDEKMAAIEAFKEVVLLFSEDYGWLCVETKTNTSENPEEDERRRQVFAFRDALAAVGKEHLFYRWIEIAQFETSRPGGFTPDRQVKVAQEIRDLFSKEGIDFDAFWKESVGQEGLATS